MDSAQPESPKRAAIQLVEARRWVEAGALSRKFMCEGSAMLYQVLQKAPLGGRRYLCQCELCPPVRSEW